MMRVTAEGDYDVLTCFRSTYNTALRQKYDKNIECAKFMERVGVNMVFAYQKTRRIMTIAGRDFYQYVFFNYMEDGSIVTAMWGEEAMPEEAGVVRM